ncbi:MAG TPA: hypothetical protein VLC94_08645, partial [Candidatus Acidoferrum sp.]|nr:hypothetical protein [Candidatus Acidoferrum sp.]
KSFRTMTATNERDFHSLYPQQNQGHTRPFEPAAIYNIILLTFYAACRMLLLSVRSGWTALPIARDPSGAFLCDGLP